MPEPRIALLILTLLLAFTLPGFATAAFQPISEGWEYRWGDSPFGADGVPEWTRSEQPEQWRSIGFPSNPPNRDGQEQVWYRVTLPAGEWQDPVLYIFSVDIIVQVYLGGEQIYQYGTFDENGRGRFEGWPWHQISLPPDYENQTLYFRVFSDYTDIGLWGEVAVMSRPDLVLYILKSSLKALITSGFSALIALLAVIFALLQTERKTFASIALFTFASSVMLVSESQASLLIAYQPLLWDYLAAGSYYTLPVALALLLEQWLVEHRSWVISLIWKLHLVYLVGAIGLALAGAVDLSSTFPPFDALLLISLLAIGVVVVRRFHQMSWEQQLLLLAYAVFCGLLIVDMAVAHGVVPWIRVPVSWGMLTFSLTVVVIALWHYARTQAALQRLNVSLEMQVAERTARAEALARREQARVRMLTYENEKNQCLGDLIASLQDCLGLSSAFGLLAESIPELCSPLRGKLYRRTNGDQYTQVAQWGQDRADDPLPVLLDAADGLPEPSQSAPAISGEKSGTDTSVSERGRAEPLCFWINLESAGEGIMTEGILLLQDDGVFSSSQSAYGSARLFAVLDQTIQRIGITLSSIALREELQRFSYEDALTGLKNRRYFNQLFDHECAVAQRSLQPLSLMLIDIDFFKAFNDSHGHEAGDKALQALATVLMKEFRESDIVCRYGGEEFVVILPRASIEDAKWRGQHLCRAVNEVVIAHQGKDIGRLTVSVGIANWPNIGREPAELLNLADQALYEAKRDGRNRVEVYGGETA